MKTSLPGFLITDRTFASFAPHALVDCHNDQGDALG